MAGDPPLAEVGQRVEPGQALAIVESIKLADVVLAPAAGVFVRMLVEQRESVTVGQPLLELVIDC